MYRLLMALGVGALMMSAASPALAETTECTEITAIPAVITTQGVYCFKQNLSTSMTSGNAIEIQTNNVTIDFNGFKLGGLAAGPTTSARGVYATARQNITLRNANIRGFQYGIYLTEIGETSSGHVIEDSLLDGNTVAAMHVRGTGVVIRNNRIINTDTSPPAETGTAGLGNGAEQPAVGNGGTANGINAYLRNSVIADNLISGTRSSEDSAHSIMLRNSSNVRVYNNTITENIALLHSHGIQILYSDRIILKGNDIAEGLSNNASYQTYGIYANSTNSNIVCRNNTIVDFADGTTYGCDIEVGTVPAAP